MTSLLGLLPCAVVALAVLVLRTSGITAAALALGVAIVLWGVGAFGPTQIGHLGHATVDALILELLVGLVIFGGLLFVEVSRRGGALEALSGAIAKLSLTPPRATILVAIGIGITLESLTGYGVSLLVTVPLLLRITSRRRAIAIALVGMSLMPWGALSVAALLGAELARLNIDVLSSAIVLTSGPVAFVLPLACLAAVTDVNRRDVVFAVLAGSALVMGITVTSYIVGIEVAGVGGGLAVIALCIVSAAPERATVMAMMARPLWPYALLIAAVVVQKPLVGFAAEFGFAPSLTSGRVTFAWLSSPALALLTASIMSLALLRRHHAQAGNALFLSVIGRSWRALTSVFLFLLTARVLVEIDAVKSVASSLSELGPYAAAAAVAVLGGLGAYVTGSGVTSNALFMPSAAATGENLDVLTLFAALQHSGAGHVAMASLPVIALLIAALPESKPNDEQTAMQMGLGLASLWLMLTISSGWLQLAIAS